MSSCCKSFIRCAKYFANVFKIETQFFFRFMTSDSRLRKIRSLIQRGFGVFSIDHHFKDSDNVILVESCEGYTSRDLIVFVICEDYSDQGHGY